MSKGAKKPIKASPSAISHSFDWNILDKIKAAAELDNSEPSFIEAVKETEELISDSRLFKNKEREANLKNLNQNIEQRKDYAHKIFCLISGWLFFTAIVTLGCATNSLYLSENVIIALLTTSSANVILIFIYVVRYLFKA